MDHIEKWVKNVASFNEARLGYCLFHLRHLDFVYSKDVCLCSQDQSDDLYLWREYNPCHQFWDCVEDLEGPPECQVHIPITKDQDFYRVSACSFLALRDEPESFKDFHQKHELPFLQRGIGGNWSCLIDKDSLSRWFNGSCHNFVVNFCEETARCLKLTDLAIPKGGRHEQVQFNNLAITSLGPWKQSHSSSVCVEEVKQDYLHVVKHLNFPNNVGFIKSQGLSLCYWNPITEEKQLVGKVENILDWFRVIQLQCADLEFCLKSTAVKHESCRVPDDQNWMLYLYLASGFASQLLMKYENDFWQMQFSRELEFYPILNTTCKANNPGVDIVPMPILEKYPGFRCIRKNRDLPCNEFSRQCLSSKKCMEEQHWCGHQTMASFVVDCSNISWVDYGHRLNEILEAIAIRCRGSLGDDNNLVDSSLYFDDLVIYDITRVNVGQTCRMKKVVSCEVFRQLCDKIETCHRRMDICSFAGHIEGLRGLKFSLPLSLQPSILPVIQHCNLQHGFEQFVTIKHEKLENDDFEFLAKSDFLIKYREDANFNFPTIEEGWYCQRWKFVNFTCSQFISVCQNIAECIQTTTSEQINGKYPAFHVLRLGNAEPEKCFEANKGLLLSTLEIFNMDLTLKEYKWPDAFSTRINEVSLVGILTQRVAIMLCSNVYIKQNDQSMIDQTESDIYFILKECDIKLHGKSSVNIMSSLNGTLLTLRCCPTGAPWDGFSCEKWISKCNNVLSCFHKWKEYIMPWQRKMLSIVQAGLSRYLVVILCILSSLFQIIYAFSVPKGKFDFLSFWINLSSCLWVYISSSLSTKSVFSNAPIRMQLYFSWISYGILPLAIYTACYFQSYKVIKKYVNIIEALRNLQTQHKQQKKSLWRMIFCFMMLFNLVRLFLDTSIVLSFCTLFQGKFDVLSFAGRSEVVAKLADRHALIRMGKEEFQNNYFLYHPNCYEFSLFISQSWTFFLYFVGIDSILLQLVPIIIKATNTYYVIKNVCKSNEFRKSNNLRLISLCSSNFVTKQIDLAIHILMTLLYFVGIASLIWSDPQGLFMDKTLSHMKLLFFNNCLLLSFARHVLLKPWRIAGMHKNGT